MIIDMTVVEKALGSIFDEIKKHGVSQIQIEDELYWNVPDEELHDMGLPLISPDVGNLLDDYSDIGRIVDGQQKPLAYHLVTISYLLREAGREISKRFAATGM